MDGIIFNIKASNETYKRLQEIAKSVNRTVHKVASEALEEFFKSSVNPRWFLKEEE